MTTNFIDNKIQPAFYQLANKKVIITGASGFVGSHLASILGRQGAEVCAISRSQRSSDTDYLSWWQVDLGDIEQVRDLFSKTQPDVIFHLASVVTGRHGLDFVLPTFHANLTSTVNLLTAATEYGKCHRIILASSLEEPELDEVGAIPYSPYGAAKWASSAYGRMFYNLYQAPVAIARLFMIYGPSQPDINKLIPSSILSLLRHEPPKVSSGKREVDWIYIDDVVEGLLALAQVPDVEGKTVDLGSGSFVSIHSVVHQIVNLFGTDIAPLYGAVPDRPPEPKRLANIAHAYEVLGWRPQISLEEGLKRTIQWHREHFKELNCNPQARVLD